MEDVFPFQIITPLLSLPPHSLTPTRVFNEVKVNLNVHLFYLSPIISWSCLHKNKLQTNIEAKSYDISLIYLRPSLNYLLTEVFYYWCRIYKIRRKIELSTIIVQKTRKIWMTCKHRETNHKKYNVVQFKLVFLENF